MSGKIPQISASDYPVFKEKARRALPFASGFFVVATAFRRANVSAELQKRRSDPAINSVRCKKIKKACIFGDFFWTVYMKKDVLPTKRQQNAR